MEPHEAREALYQCLSGLGEGHVKRLMRHVAKNTPILCGCPEAGHYFINKGVGDPIILASYEAGPWCQEAIISDLHCEVQNLYYDIGYRSEVIAGYSNALETLSQHEVRSVILRIAAERKYPIE